MKANKEALIHKWIFSVKTFEEETFFLNEKGEQTERDDAIPFIGNEDDGEKEMDRRALRWEERYDSLCMDTSKISLEVIESTPLNPGN